MYKSIIGKYDTPIMYNLNFGHSHPRCTLPYGARVEVDLDNKK
ncbi:MAG: hypothetical protein LBN09_06740 [Clostridioides sp.]|nr:hypothetical protein [Clostridioides sp.]